MLGKGIFYFNLLKFVEICLAAQNMVYHGDVALEHLRRMCTLLLLGRTFYIRFVRSGWFIVLFMPSFFLMISIDVLFMIENGVLKFSAISVVVLFLPSILSRFASYILDLCCLVYIFLELLYHLGDLTILSII